MRGWAILPRKSDRQNGQLIRAALAEMFGTFSLVFWGVGSVLQYTSVDTVNPLSIALAFGLATTTTAYLFHDISGSHLNPAVSLAMFVAQRISLLRCILYWAMQFLGAVFGAAVLRALNGSLAHGGVVLRKSSAASDPVNVEAVGELQGFFLEFIGTLAIVYTYLAATNPHRNQRVSSYDYPLALGVVLFAVHITLVPLTGCGVNPARAIMVNALAKDSTSSLLSSQIWVYIVAPLIASIVGGITYELIFSYPLEVRQGTTRGVQRDETTLSSTPGPAVESNNTAFKSRDIVLANTSNGGSICYE